MAGYALAKTEGNNVEDADIKAQEKLINDIEEVVDNLGATPNYYDTFWDSF